MTVAGQANGTGGSSASHLQSPSSVRIDSSGGIYVADTNNNRIQYWAKNASLGLTVAGNGTSKSTKMITILKNIYAFLNINLPIFV